MTVSAILKLLLHLQPSLLVGGQATPEAREMAAAFHDASHSLRIRAPLLVALSMGESSLHPNAENVATGCAGLMMIAAIHHSDRHDPRNIRWNVLTGAAILRHRLDRHAGSELLAVSAYHRKTPPSTDDEWAKAILATADQLEKMADEGAGAA